MDAMGLATTGSQLHIAAGEKAWVVANCDHLAKLSILYAATLCFQ
jgi:hypothetical protein